MKTSTFSAKFGIICALLTFAAVAGQTAELRPKLNIRHDRENNRVVVSWYGGEGQLGRAQSFRSAFQRTVVRETPATLEIEGENGAYALVDAAGGVVSQNIVGYVNLPLPWGMSLIANPFFQTNATVVSLFPTAPNGAQIMKLVNGDYVTVTYSADRGGWVGPQLELPLGVGFFFINPARETFMQTFVGEVAMGSLTNHLPAGVSLEGSLLPQSGSINTLHNIPGQPGDIIFVFLNEGEARGRYLRSTYSAGEGWYPDLNLGVAQGFWSQKKQPQDWVRSFSN
jgi:hypothetical protein